VAGIADLRRERLAEIQPEQRHITPPSFHINPRHVRTLLWLRWKLTVRGYTRNWQRALGLVFILLLFAIFAAVVGLGSAAAYLNLPRPTAIQVLFGALGALYLIWAVLPLLQYSLNEGLDVTKLQAYPLTRGEQMTSLVLATLLDVSTLFILALYAAVVIGWHTTPVATAVTVVALLAAYVHTVGFSQLVLAGLMGLLRSRRYRDLAVVFFAVVGTSCSIANQVVVSRLSRDLSFSDPAALADLHIDRVLQWTPPGMAAKAIVLADAGRFIEAVPWLVLSLALVPLLLAAWAWVLDRGITSAESAGAGAGRRRLRIRRPAARPAGAGVGAQQAPAVATVPAARAMGRRWRPLRGPVLAIARKDALYLWRDPQLKAALLSSLLATVFIFVPNLYGGGRASSAGGFFAGPASVLFAPLPALLVVLVLSLNAFGLERQALQTLFLFPVRPLDVFWGKNLVTGGIALALEVVLTCAKAVLTDGWSYVPMALGIGVAALLVMLGCGNVTSVLAPFRARSMRMGETSTMASENGCLRSIISMATLGVAALLLLPVGLAVAVPQILQHPEWLFVSLPAAVIYGLALHQVATRLIAPVLLRRAPEILAVTVREA